MNQKATNIFKAIGKVIAVLITPGSLIALFIIAVFYFYYQYKKKKEANNAPAPAADLSEPDKIKTDTGINK